MAADTLAQHFWKQLSDLSDNAYAALDAMVGVQEECEHLDFTLFYNRPDAEKKLAKSLCSFANSSGGVLIFGVRAEKNAAGVEKARELVPVADAAMEAVWLLERGASIADPPIANLEVTAICPPSLKGSGFIVCFVPASKSAPHRTSNAGGHRWLMRSPTGNIDIPPAILRQMFLPESKVRMHAQFDKYSGHHYALRTFSKRGNPFKAFTLCLQNLGELSAKEASFNAWLSHGNLWQRDVSGEFQQILPTATLELKGTLHPGAGQSFDCFVEWKTKQAIPLFHLKFFATDLVPQALSNIPVADLGDDRKAFALETIDLGQFR